MAVAEEKKYNIISVDSHDEDEIVIEAGAKRRKPTTKPESEVATPGEEDLAGSEGDENGEAQEEQAAPEESHEAPEESHEAPEESHDEERESPADDEGYQETTLDDLKSEGPMTRMRLIILGLAFLVLFAFLIYYNFMR